MCKCNPVGLVARPILWLTSRHHYKYRHSTASHPTMRDMGPSLVQWASKLKWRVALSDSGDEKDDAKAPRSKKRTKAVSQIILYELNKTSSNNYKGKFHADRHCFCVDKKRVIHRGFSGYKAIPKDRLCTQSKCLVAFADMIQSDDHMKRSQP